MTLEDARIEAAWLREREAERLREERDRPADALLLLRRQRALVGETSRRQSIAADLARLRTAPE